MKTKTNKPFVNTLLKRNFKKYTEELKRLEKKYSGMISPKDIVREASSERNPLHDWFDWEDNSAGEKWRIYQARQLMNQIKVKIMFEDGLKEYKKYLNVRISTDNNKTFKNFYVNTRTVINNEDMRTQILQKAVKEAEYWEKSYEDYKELEDIFKGIKKTKKKLKKILVTN